VGKITGLEICPDCEEKTKGVWDEIDKISRRSQLSIQKKADKAKADLESALMKVLKKEE
jgi:hypothetical protein